MSNAGQAGTRTVEEICVRLLSWRLVVDDERVLDIDVHVRDLLQAQIRGRTAPGHAGWRDEGRRRGPSRLAHGSRGRPKRVVGGVVAPIPTPPHTTKETHADLNDLSSLSGAA